MAIPLIIGLTGLRGVGKTTVAEFLAGRGFRRCHAFDGGKAACVAYFEHLGASGSEAHAMVHGLLKDTPSRWLPGRATPRTFMERFGRFMGVEMGAQWTLGAELDRLLRADPSAPIVVESVVYEAPALRDRGGKIVRITRPRHKGPVGLATDQAQAEIRADNELVNAGTVADLEGLVMGLLRELGA